MRIASLALLALLGSLAACGDDPTPDNDPDAAVDPEPDAAVDPEPDAAVDPDNGAITAEEAEPICQRGCEHTATCEAVNVPECVADCVDDVTGRFREDAMEAYVACVEDLTCKTSEATCLPACEPLAVHDAYEAGCRATFDGCFTPAELDQICEVTPGTDFEDANLLCLYAPGIIEDMTACFDGEPTCPAATDCVEAVLAANGLD